MPLIRKHMVVGLIGTSLIQGRLNTGWPERFYGFARALPSCVGPFDQFNNGKGSTNSGDGLATIALTADQKPTHVIFDAFDINDRALIAGVPEVTLAQSVINKTAIVAALRAANPDVVIGMMTMSDVSAAGQAGRPDLAAGYAQTRALAVTLAVDLIDNYAGTVTVPGGWPKPGPDGIYQIDPTTGLPDGLHPIASAVDTYMLPNVLAWIGAKQAAFWV